MTWTLCVLAVLLALAREGEAATDSCKSCVDAGLKWCYVESADGNAAAAYCLPAGAEDCAPAGLKWQQFNSRLDCMYGGENGEALIAPMVIGSLLIIGIIGYLVYLCRAYAPPKLDYVDAEPVRAAEAADPRVRAASSSPNNFAPGASGPIPTAKMVPPNATPADSLV